MSTRTGGLISARKPWPLTRATGAGLDGCMVGVVVLVLVLLSCHADPRVGEDAGTFLPETFPNPRLDLEKCGRDGVESRICDPSRLLGEEHANKIEEYIKTIQRDTESGCGGFQVAVAIIDQIDPTWPTAATPREDAARAFAMKIHDAWGVGDRSCQNGILLFISRRDRRVYISTGSGAKTSLSLERDRLHR